MKGYATLCVYVMQCVHFVILATFFSMLMIKTATMMMMRFRAASFITIITPRTLVIFFTPFKCLNEFMKHSSSVFVVGVLVLLLA